MRIPVVYVHGFIGHLDIPELFEGLDALAPDLLGFGAYADAGTSRMSVAQQARHLAREVEAWAGHSPAIVVGHSAGATVAVNYARRHPERVAALVSAEGNLAPSDAFLCSRLAPMSPAAVVQWLEQSREHPAKLLAGDGRRLSEQALARFTDWLHHQEADVVHAAARAVLMETLRPGYAAEVSEVMARTPTFLMRGEHTPPGLGVPPRLRELAADEFVIPGSGHAMVIENPEAVARAILRVQARLAERTSTDAASTQGAVRSGQGEGFLSHSAR